MRLRPAPLTKAGLDVDEAKNVRASPANCSELEAWERPKEVKTPTKSRPQTATPKASIMAGLRSKSKPRRCRRVMGRAASKARIREMILLEKPLKKPGGGCSC